MTTLDASYEMDGKTGSVPFFSIIVPIYNVERYLNDCLDSVLTQKYDDYELICVENGSIDRSKEILSSYGVKYPDRISIIEIPENKGVSAARNCGMVAAKGRYILFLDSDDMFAEGALCRIREILEDFVPDILCFNWRRMDLQDYDAQDEVKTFNRKVMTGKQYFHKRAKNYCFDSWVWMKAYSRSFINANCLRFYEGLLSEDVLFTAQVMMAANKVMETEEIFYIYRYNKNSLSTKITSKNYHSEFVVILELYRLWKEQMTNEADEALYMYIRNCYRFLKKWESALLADEELTVGTMADSFMYRVFRRDPSLEFEIIPLTEECMIKIKNSPQVWLYGPGGVGLAAKEYLTNEGVMISGFLISKGRKEKDSFEGLPILEYGDPGVRSDDMIIITVAERYINEIKAVLEKSGVKNWIAIHVM